MTKTKRKALAGLIGAVAALLAAFFPDYGPALVVFGTAVGLHAPELFA